MSRLKKALAIALAVVASKPAHSSAQWTIRQQDPLEVASRWMGKTILLDTMVTWTSINAPRTRTFDAAVRILQHFKFPIERADSSRRLVFNRNFVPHGGIADKPLSHWFRCGTGLTGDYADTWRLTMAYAVYTDSTAPDKTGLGVAFFASATNTEGASKPPVLCATTGKLEAEIARMVAYSSS